MKHLLNKLIGKQTKHWISNLPNQEKHFFFKPISIEGFWMVGLTKLEVYNSFFVLTEKK